MEDRHDDPEVRACDHWGVRALCVRSFVCAHARVCVSVSVCVCVCACVRLCVRTRVCVRAHLRVRGCACVCARVTHSGTESNALSPHA